ncbi:VCBS repeat-containing protein [Persicimonas caeni]|uniref:VCBS repeat-containing protein n=2 Tax=Persicimonas caeni TaxID=2292766 RepID=A0A4Y6PUE4_PERCE|nr:VCBS repeat-containing protein [Persicimonas caeni]QED33084.1 VCBS repeat-containing protein [Persicimonas caeni]
MQVGRRKATPPAVVRIDAHAANRYSINQQKLVVSMHFERRRRRQGVATMRYSVLVPSLLLALGVSASASAESKVYNWPDSDMPVLVENDSGLIFITNEKRPHRVYTWKARNDGDADNLYLVDLDGDQSYEVVGAGKPTFVLKTNSDPMWQLEKGCDQTIVADFVADDKLDLLCQNSKAMKVYTYDGQFVWELSLGRRIDHCRAGDYNGDLKADLECKYRGMNKWARIDAAGEVLAKELAEPEIAEDAVDLSEASPVELSDAVKKAAKGAEIDGEVQAGLQKDLDGDGKTETVAVTDKSIFIISADGKTKEKFAASAKKYSRKPFAKLNSVYANNFADNQKAQEVVNGLQDKLSKCYASRVRRNRFTGTGQLILTVNVNEKGKVSAVNKLHSAINDKKVENCAKKVLKRGDFPKAEGGTGTINVNMKYTFRDE